MHRKEFVLNKSMRSQMALRHAALPDNCRSYPHTISHLCLLLLSHSRFFPNLHLIATKTLELLETSVMK